MQLNKLYICNSRILTHILFWVVYYFSFSLIWSVSSDYFESFYLEFVLLPTRILAVYTTIYFLLPDFLLQKKYLNFGIYYTVLILLAAVLQHFFIYFFYEGLLSNTYSGELLSFKMIIRAGVLINTTVFLVLVIKVFQLYMLEKSKNEEILSNYIEIKADRRIYRIKIDDILFVEGKGNYTTYNFTDNKKITAYGSIKKSMELLPENFIRVHKSYVINKNKIKSFDANSIEIKNTFIPRGKSVNDDVLLTKLKV